MHALKLVFHQVEITGRVDGKITVISDLVAQAQLSANYLGLETHGYGLPTITIFLFNDQIGTGIDFDKPGYVNR